MRNLYSQINTYVFKSKTNVNSRGLSGFICEGRHFVHAPCHAAPEKHMSPSLDVIFLAKDGTPHASRLEYLQQLGFSVQRCHDLKTLYACQAARPSKLLVLSASGADIQLASWRMRAMAPDIGIVALLRHAGSAARIRALQSGVDICLPADTDGLELAAILHALMRRMEATHMVPQPATRAATGAAPKRDKACMPDLPRWRPQGSR